MRSIYCQKCGELFECQVDEKEGCWCKNYDNVLINSEIKDCLCSKCLKLQKRKLDLNND